MKSPSRKWQTRGRDGWSKTPRYKVVNVGPVEEPWQLPNGSVEEPWAEYGHGTSSSGSVSGSEIVAKGPLGRGSGC